MTELVNWLVEHHHKNVVCSKCNTVGLVGLSKTDHYSQFEIRVRHADRRSSCYLGLILLKRLSDVELNQLKEANPQLRRIIREYQSHFSPNRSETSLARKLTTLHDNSIACNDEIEVNNEL